MKYLKYSLFVCLCLFLSSCDEEDVLEFFEDPEVDITTNFVLSVGVDIQPLSDPEQSVSFFEGTAIDILSNPQVAEEIGEPDRIKEVVINSITYEFKNFTGNVDADVVGFISLPGPDGDVSYDVPSVNAAEADLFGTIYNLEGNFSPVNQQVSELKGIGFIFSGNSSHNPVDFRLEVVINATVTVEVNLDDL